MNNNWRHQFQLELIRYSSIWENIMLIYQRTGILNTLYKKSLQNTSTYMIFGEICVSCLQSTIFKLKSISKSKKKLKMNYNLAKPQ